MLYIIIILLIIVLGVLISINRKIFWMRTEHYHRFEEIEKQFRELKNNEED